MNTRTRLPSPTELSRRKFLRTVLVTSAVASTQTGEWSRLLLVDLQAAERVSRLDLNVSDYPALARDYGSVRLGTSDLISGQFPRGLFHPILINRAPNNQFHALSAECTHASCAVRTYAPATASGGMVCPCHSSRFGIDGRRLVGPANAPLSSYPLTFDGSNRLSIELPDWVFIGTGTLAESPAGSPGRFRLEFLSFTNLTYEVRFRESLDQAWRVVPFSLSPNGAADQTSLPGRDDTTVVYVDRIGSAGFYAVTLRLKTV